MPGNAEREREIVLAPNEYTYIRDTTKGAIKTAVGPTTLTLTQQDEPVAFDTDSKKFRAVSPDKARQLFVTAPEGWYVQLLNPVKEGNEHPSPKSESATPDLDVGRRIIVHGPVSFALWPGQIARVIRGHKLRTNQYLMCEVYDAEEARKNWKSAIIEEAEEEKSKKEEPVSAPKDEDGEIEEDDNKSAPPEKKKEKKKTLQEEFDKLVNGQRIIIKGTEVAFYIPPTGVKVVPMSTESQKYTGDKFIRNAVTLEAMEYAVLLSEQGDKEFPRGPAVVFPSPDQWFVRKGETRRFRAIELNDISGIYVKVLADYKDDGGKEYKTGDELFITGKQQRFYFPRKEHALISYNKNQEIHFGVAIPAGEGRYLMDRINGDIKVIKGPTILLPDPRKEVVVRRILDEKDCKLWFPGNDEAVGINKDYAEIADALANLHDNNMDEIGAGDELYGSEEAALSSVGSQVRGITQKSYSRGSRHFLASRGAPTHGYGGDTSKRKDTFTTPRTITLDTKYEGAVVIDVWPGFAVQVVSKTGQRRVEVGPKTLLLEYYEGMEKMALSTGKPKSDTQLLETVYLNVENNKVSDIVHVETADMVPVLLKLSYRVRFEGDSQKWFHCSNYVKLLTDHLRSLLKSAIKDHNIIDFYKNGSKIIRDVVLGEKALEEVEVEQTAMADEAVKKICTLHTKIAEVKKKDIAPDEMDAEVRQLEQKIKKVTEESKKTKKAKKKIPAGERPGRFFDENQMKVYDVEILQLKIDDESISQLLHKASEDELTFSLKTKTSEAELEATKRNEVISRAISDEKARTKAHERELTISAIKDRLKVMDEEFKEFEHVRAEAKRKVEAELDRQKLKDDAEVKHRDDLQALKIKSLEARTKAIVDEMGAIPDDYIVALKDLGVDIKMAEFSKNFAGLSVVKGLEIGTLADKYLDRTRFVKQEQQEDGGNPLLHSKLDDEDDEKET